MQIFLIATGILILLVFIIPLFEDVKNSATAVGTAGGLFPLAVGLLWEKIGTHTGLIVAIAYYIGLAVLLCFMLIILIKSKSTATNQSVIIVLGCKVKGDKPSLSLVKRVDAAYAFLTENESAVAVLSGGQGADESISEARCMYNMLTEKGIDKKRLILEDKSKTTDENIRFSARLINTDSVAIATSEYHQLRAKRICERYGLRAYAKSSPTKPIILPTFLLREVMAMVKEIMKNKGIYGER